MSGVAAIVVAAGLSRRMGSCKQLLELGGRTALARCLETLLAGGIREIVVVVAATKEEIFTVATPETVVACCCIEDVVTAFAKQVVVASLGG